MAQRDESITVIVYGTKGSALIANDTKKCWIKYGLAKRLLLGSEIAHEQCRLKLFKSKHLVTEADFLQQKNRLFSEELLAVKKELYDFAVQCEKSGRDPPTDKQINIVANEILAKKIPRDFLKTRVFTRQLVHEMLNATSDKQKDISYERD